MHVPLSWLKKHLELTAEQKKSLTPEKISEVLTLAGLEVDKVEHTPFSFKGVVIAKILEAHQHPEAERLRVAKVTDGSSEFQIVCGASNCRSGLTTALAKIGAELTTASGEKFKIKKSKLRGVDSEGMLCAADELGLQSSLDGIMELDSSLPLGASLDTVIGDTIFEISLTPNLGHCLSIHGVARELASLMNLKMAKPHLLISSKETLRVEDLISVKIQDLDKCYTYSCRYLENVQVGPSPNWLKESLENCGIRSINNVVDVTNYIMLGYGQPMHAFDYDKIEGSSISIQSFDDSTSLQTLDGIDRVIPANTLLICDESKPLAVAGIIGGESSSIKETTTRIVLESAHFDPSCIRKSMKQLGIRTDSSSRFEKGIDSARVKEALDMACSLLQEMTNCDVATGIIYENTKPFIKKQILCRVEKINRILGTHLSLHEIQQILHRLFMETKLDEQKQILHVIAPTFRNDIKEEIDLVEEIARVYGYHHIQASTPYVINSQIPHSPLYIIEKRVRKKLTAEGLQELLTCDLISPKLAQLSTENFFQEQKLLHVMQPSSIDQSILRPSMLAGLLETAKRNFDHQTFSLAGFEIGKIHFKEGPAFIEKPSIGIILTGASNPHHFSSPTKDYDAYDLKGILENLFESLCIKNITFKNSQLERLHPGQQGTIYYKDILLGFFGQVHPEVLQELDIKQKIFFAQLDITSLIELSNTSIKMKPLPIYPGSDRDWTGTFKEQTLMSDILTATSSISSRLLKKVSLLDIYRSDKLGNDKKNITLRFYYRDDDKTIAQEAVDKEHARVLSMTQTKLKDLIF